MSTIPVFDPAPARRKNAGISHYPRPSGTQTGSLSDPVACEKLLSEWFGHPVILLSSGRVGLDLYLRAKGFNRYRHRLQVPPFLSRCVINSLTASVFPVDMSSVGDGVLFYHQYGFTQRAAPRHSVVLEDAAHSFFATADSGGHRWIGEAATFSLPKFFPVAGMAGGIIVRNPEIEQKIRELVRASLAAPPRVCEWMREIISCVYDPDPDALKASFVDSAYELLLKFPHPYAPDLTGFPASLEEIATVGLLRRERVRMFRDYFGDRAFPDGFVGANEILLSFALPYFGRGDAAVLERINSALLERGIHAGIYHVDVRRDAYIPDYAKCVLLTCHQHISEAEFEEMCRTISIHEQ